MGRFKILILAVALFLALITDTEGQWQPPDVANRPLCASQIALANYACAMLPYSTIPPPPPPLLSHSDNLLSQDPQPSHRDHHEHQHRHQHADQHGQQYADQHRHQHRLSPLERNCCKWVQQLDSECICGLLSHLPAFLERPQHNFSLTVGGSCEATYSCRGGMKT